MINTGNVVSLKSDNRRMAVDGISNENEEEVECAWWNGKYIQFDTFSLSSLTEVEDCHNELFNVGDVVSLKSGDSPNFVIAEIEGNMVSFENNSNTYDSWLFKKV